MWSRSELKDRAKWVLKQCYWKAVLMSLILGISIGRGSSVSVSRTFGNGSYQSIFGNSELQNLIYFITLIMAVSLFATIIGLALKIFLFQPLEVNTKRFFIISRVQPAELGELGFCFKNGYRNVVKVQFLRGLYTFLWTLLFVIPGIIKSYEYRMVPYILAENPDMDGKEVFQISRDMMYGEKWNAFILDLSFVGWYILSLFTCGLLAIFYVSPYEDLTDVELYDALKRKLFENNGNSGNNGYNENDINNGSNMSSGSYGNDENTMN